MTKTIIITGASQGIGQTTAEAFLDAGWIVGCLARNADKLAAFCDIHDGAVPLAADVSDSAAVEAAFADFIDKTGRLDALFNNAGRGSAALPIDEIDDETWNSVVGVNLTGMFNCARAAFRQMRAQDPQGGRTCYWQSRVANEIFSTPALRVFVRPEGQAKAKEAASELDTASAGS